MLIGYCFRFLFESVIGQFQFLWFVSQLYGLQSLQGKYIEIIIAEEILLKYFIFRSLDKNIVSDFGKVFC